MENIIETESLTKKFGELTAVNTVTLNVRKGSLFGLLGPNGSGKTTMIKMLTGQILPSSGNAHVLGHDVATDPVGIRTLVGIIPEQESPPSFLTAMEYLEFIGDIRKIPDLEQKADWWFDFLEYGDKRNVLCKDLSRGTRQKLMLTQAFIHNPALALIDEPLINFDPIMQDKVKAFFGKEPAPYEANVSSIYTSVPIEQDTSFLVIGERTNATGSRAFRDLLLAGDLDGIVGVAREQAAEGAHVLDVSVDYVGRDGTEDMTRVATALRTQSTLPPVFDSTEVAVVETALKLYGGKAIINSINLEDGERKIRRLLPLIKRHGAAAIALTIDEEGQARTTVNGKRIYLGEYDSPESRKAYEKILAEWEANHAERTPAATVNLTVSRLAFLFLKHAEQEYVRDLSLIHISEPTRPY